MYCKTAALSFLALLLACAPAQAEIKCPADVTGNFMVNIDDLLAVIGAYGLICPASPCPPDTNNSGVVDIDDLLNVINGWGPCVLVFTLDPPPADDADAPSSDEKKGQDVSDPEGGAGVDSNSYCIYRIDAVAQNPPGTPQALAVGQIICIHCPITYMNACPPLANCRFNKAPGVPTAVSTGVNATSLGNGFCQICPQTVGGFKYR